MKAIKCFDVDLNIRELISIVGGGGKTTTMFQLAKDLKAMNKKVLVTTTTAIYVPKPTDYDNLVILDKKITCSRYPDNTITIIGSKISSENKLIGIGEEYLSDLYKASIFDYIIVEADGSKRKPIKAPASHEPVIPTYTTKTIGVIGIDSLGKKINEENVHRPEIFADITRSKMEDRITEEILSRLIISEDGLFKGVPDASNKYVLINKADNKEDMLSAYRIKELVYDKGYIVDGFVAGSMKENNAIRIE